MDKPQQLERERKLLRAIRKGDPSAWGQIYDLYAPALYRRILMPRLANPTAAEDALSETFRTAIEKLHQYEEQPTGIYPWLARIAQNKAMDMHRAKAITGRKLTDLFHLLAPVTDVVLGADDLLELKLEERSLGERMSACLSQLNPRYQRALDLRFLQDKGREDCAALLEIKVETFEVLLLRAVRSLKKSWEESAGSNG